ncbi:MAG: TIGR04442 family protein [Geobacter sp.]|jgi:uncharacterized protein (TIGR04442 family)|nr:TIGR04442 family protein [Geobacter sp.]
MSQQQHPDQLSLNQALALIKLLVLPSGQEVQNPTLLQLKQLLCAKKRALATADRSFDALLLDLGKLLDEQIQAGAPEAIKKRLLQLADYFHKLEAAAGHLNHLAFMGSAQLDVEELVQLKHDMELFDSFEPGFFRRLFVEELLLSPLLDSYGRRRIKILLDGLAATKTIKLQNSDMKLYDLMAVQQLIEQLKQLEQEERLFMVVVDLVAEQSRLNQATVSSPQGRETIKRIIVIELRKRLQINHDIPEELFNRAVELVKLEAIYTNAVLPQILRGNHALRQEFITKSKLDLFYIEDLENRYCNENGIDPAILEQLRSG